MPQDEKMDQTQPLKPAGQETPPPLPLNTGEQTQLFKPSPSPIPGPEGPIPAGVPRPLLDEGQATVAFKPFTQFKVEGTPIQPTLEVTAGTANQKLFYLGTEKLKIGRSGYNEIILTDDKVSRSHAVIYFEDGYYFIEDLNSTNGVLVDDKLIHKIILKSGHKITLGDTELLFTQKVPEISLEEKAAFIEKSDLLNWLDQETKFLLAQNLVVRYFPKEAVVLQQNTLVESMYFLFSGEVRIVEINEEGGERTIDRLRSGDFFGERALLAGESGNYSMIADTDSHLLELRKEALNELLQKKPDLNQAFYRMVLKKLRSAQVASDQKEGRQDNLKHIITSTDVEIIGEDRKILEAKKKIEKFGPGRQNGFNNRHFRDREKGRCPLFPQDWASPGLSLCGDLLGGPGRSKRRGGHFRYRVRSGSHPYERTYRLSGDDRRGNSGHCPCRIAGCPPAEQAGDLS